MDISSFKNRIKDIVSILVIGLTIIYFSFKACSNKTPIAGTTKKIDTVYVEKVIKVPAISGKFETFKPKEKSSKPAYNDSLYAKYLKLKDENAKLEEFKKAIQVRDYKETYSNDADSTVVITVSNSVTGTLNKQNIDFKVKEREIKYIEKTITETTETKLKPFFIISAGGSFQTSTDLLNLTPSVGASIGFKNKKGYTLDLNYNTNKNVMVTLKKDIFTFWSKKE